MGGLFKAKSGNVPISEFWEPLAGLSLFLTTEPAGAQTQERLQNLLAAIFPEQSGMLLRYNRNQNTLDSIAAFGDVEHWRNNFHPESCEAMQRAAVFSSVEGDARRCSHLKGTDASILCVPLRAEEEVNGLLVIENTIPHEDVESAEYIKQKQQLDVVSSILGLYFANFDLKQKFQLHSIRDPLTGLFNRRYLEESLQREVASAHRRKVPVGMIMLHVDNLMEVRDAHGRKAAEHLIWEIGRQLPGYIRTEDIPCRFSKMVFAIIMPTASLEVTTQRAERIREEVSALRIGFQNAQLSTTLSLGVGIIPNHASDAQSLLQVSEEALFSAVYSGGDKVGYATE